MDGILGQPGFCGGGNSGLHEFHLHAHCRAFEIAPPLPDADEAEERLKEAKVLRGIIDEHFKANPDGKLIVIGDFNDVQNSDSTKEIIGRGKFKLTDTRPAERNGDNAPAGPPYFERRNVAWTYFYGPDDTYARVDYILLSPAIVRGWVKTETYIPTIPNWGIGSDHRPIVATFTTDTGR